MAPMSALTTEAEIAVQTSRSMSADVGLIAAAGLTWASAGAAVETRLASSSGTVSETRDIAVVRAMAALRGFGGIRSTVNLPPRANSANSGRDRGLL